ncbi:MAG: metal-dependent hydrolase [Nitrospiraceae bacterium]
MDALTHTCSGILLGHALRPIPAVRRQTLVVLGLAALAPDVDVVAYLWGPETYSRFHHTYTHTIWGVIFLALLLAAIEQTWVRQISFPRLFGLNLAGCSIHMLGDMIALWPLQLLWPLSDHDFALRWTGDFDLVVLIVVGLATGLAATDGLQGRARWMLGGVVLILAGYFWWFPGVAGLR